jgi:hypothetical protein
MTRNAILTAVLALLAPAVLAAPQKAAWTELSFPAARVLNIKISGELDGVVMQGVAASTVTVERTGGAAQTVTAKLSGGTLTIDMAPLARGLTRDLKSGLRVTLPAATAVSVREKTGSVELDNISGRVDVVKHAGLLLGEGLSGKLTIINIGGTADMDKLSCPVYLKQESGSADLSWSAAPQSGELDVVAHAGDVTLRIPAAIKVNADLRGNAAKIVNEFEASGGMPVFASVASTASFRLLKIQPAAAAQPAAK